MIRNEVETKTIVVKAVVEFDKADIDLLMMLRAKAEHTPNVTDAGLALSYLVDCLIGEADREAAAEGRAYEGLVRVAMRTQERWDSTS